MSDVSPLPARQPQEVTISAVVIRADGTREDQGVVAYWDRNPLRRLAWVMREKVRRWPRSS